MTLLHAGKQPRLPLRTCTRLVVAGIGFRLLRSGITMAIQAVAIAFLLFMLAGTIIDHAVLAAARAQLAPQQSADALFTRLGTADPAERIVQALRSGPTPAQVAEFSAWSGTDEATIRGAAQRLADAAPGDTSDTPGDTPADVQSLAASIHRGHRTAVRNLAASLPPVSPAAWIAQPGDALLPTLRAQGFAVTPEQLDALRPFAERALARTRITEALQQPAFKQSVARRADVPVSRVTPDTALSILRNDDDAAWMAQQLASINSPTPDLAMPGTAPPDSAVLLDTATQARTVARLRAALATSRTDTAAASTRLAGLPVRTVLLLGLSLLVCVVGITNAMFMSVAERFGEIATMKCLGALNGSVMWMYLIEAVILGSIGGAAGVALGFLLAAGNGLLQHGRLLGAAVTALPELWSAAAIAWVLGVVLAVVAAIVPSLGASRLSPMAAMRVE